jgi:hypothetical protein
MLPYDVTQIILVQHIFVCLLAGISARVVIRQLFTISGIDANLIIISIFLFILLLFIIEDQFQLPVNVVIMSINASTVTVTRLFTT